MQDSKTSTEKLNIGCFICA